MAGQNTKIIATDYNTIQKNIAAVMGVGGTNPVTNTADISFGYNQTMGSNQVSVNAKISNTQWANLRSDILKARQHQTGNAESLSITSVSNKITDSIRADYSDMANLCVTDKLVTPPSSQATRDILSQGVITTPWNLSAVHTVTMQFSSVTAPRYFFNTGGYFDLDASRTGGTVGLKNSSWTTMLANMGVITFGRTSSTVTGSGSLTSALGWADLTSTNQLLFRKTTEAPTYTPNAYEIYVKTGTDASQIVFTISFNDLSTGPNPYGIDEDINGTLTSTVESYRATGSNVSIAAPTITSTFVAS